MTVNRVVAFCTPFFTIAAVAVSQVVLTKTGLKVPPEVLVPVETTVAASAAGAALKWLHGHQKYEEMVHEALLLSATTKATV